ncbi:MAG: flagellar assembly peptidoglycan hydrolase FlgJ [Bradyrhizobium sp.]|nr:flagellar assembly peptidoglycan hydrolase FlgJ [Bradyrhizobium sp.]
MLQAKAQVAAQKLDGSTNAKAKASAEDFEAVFLNTMFQQMFTGIEGDGPFGGSGATGVWRSFLTDEYSRSFAKAGGLGIANEVYKTLIAQQEIRG